jgi:hypothetical protein
MSTVRIYQGSGFYLAAVEYRARRHGRPRGHRRVLKVRLIERGPA